MRYFYTSLILLSACFLQAQKPTLIIPTGHDDNIKALQYLPTGQYFLSGGSQGTIKLWEAATGREFFTYPGHTSVSNIEAIAVSPDGRAFASFSSGWGTSNKITVHKTFSGSLKWEKEIAEAAVSAIVVTDTTVLLAQENTLASYRLSDGEKQWELKVSVAPLTAMALHPLRQAVVLGDESGNCTLIDLARREKISTQKPFQTAVVWLQYSEDGAGYFAASKDGRVLTPKQGSVLDLQQTTPLYQVAVSRDGRWLAAVFFEPGQGWRPGKPAYGKVYEIRPGGLREVRDLALNLYEPAIAIGPQSKHLIHASKNNTGEIIMERLENGKVVQVFTKHSEVVTDLEVNNSVLLTLSPDFFGTSHAYFLDRMLVRMFKPEVVDGTLNAATLTSDEQQALLAQANITGKIRRWDLISQEVETLCTLDMSAKLIADARDSVSAFVSDGSSIKRVALATGATMVRYKSNIREITEIQYAPQTQHLAASGKSGTAVWNAESGALISVFPQEDPSVPTVAAFSADGSKIVVSTSEKSVSVWSLDSLQETGVFPHTTVLSAAAFGPNQQYLVTGDEAGAIHRWDIESGNKIKVLKGHQKEVLSLAFSPDGSRLFCSSRDRTILIWDIEKGEQLGTIINWDDEEWVVTTPQGLYDASPGAMERMYYISPDPATDSLEVIALTQLSKGFYDPGLLPKLFIPETPLLSVNTDLDEIKLFPKVSGSIQGDMLILRLEEREGGLGRVSLFLNGKELVEDLSSTDILEEKDGVYTAEYNLLNHADYLWANPDSTNLISIEVTGEDRELSSSRKSWVYPRHRSKGISGASTGGSDEEDDEFLLPKLYIISVGTSDYEGDDLDLSYPDRDAAYMATALYNTGKRLFGERVTAYALTTDSSPLADSLAITHYLPAKDSIEMVFEAVKNASNPEDIVIAYFSGHGVSGVYDNEDVEFYYLTSAIESADKMKRRRQRESSAVSSAELTEWLNAIKAQKQALILDACYSGAAVDLMGEVRGKSLTTSQVRAYERMRNRTGLFLLSSSTADKESYESSTFGNGLLTYALLSGMRGEGDVFDIDPDDAKFINLVKLFTSVRDRVPVLAKSIREAQTPTLKFPGAASGVLIGQFGTDSEIPIGNAKPPFLRPVFQLADGYGDPAGLNSIIEQILKQESNEGSRAKWAYKDLYYAEGCYSLAGRYTQEGEDIIISAKLFYDKEEVHSFECTVPRTRLSSLDRAVKNELTDFFESQSL